MTKSLLGILSAALTWIALQAPLLLPVTAEAQQSDICSNPPVLTGQSVTDVQLVKCGAVASGGVTANGTATLTNKTLNYSNNTLVLPLAINLQQLNACGITDATTIFNAAALTAASTGQALYIPNGCTINHSGTLTLNGLQLLGDGIGSVLNATDTAASSPHLSLQVEGNGVVVEGINFETTNTAGRSSQVYSAAISIPHGVGAVLTNFRIANNFFTGAFAGPYIQLDDGGSDGNVTGNMMTGAVESNPIILQPSVTRINIDDNHIIGGGDNCIEVVDYSDLAVSAVSYINIVNNKVENCGANGIAILGASHVNVVSNQVILPADRGIEVASESGFTESHVQNVNVIGNSIAGAGSGTADYYIFVYGTDGFTVANVNILSNTVDMTGPAFTGIQIGSCDGCSSIDVTGINVSTNIINGDGTHGGQGIVIRSAVADVTLSGNLIAAMNTSAVEVLTSVQTGMLKILGNQMSNLSLTTTGTSPAIALGSPGFTQVEILNNTYTAGANAVSNFLTCTGGTNPIAGFNTGSTVTTSGCTFGAATINSSLDAGAYFFTSGANYGFFCCGGGLVTAETAGTTDFTFGSTNTSTVPMAFSKAVISAGTKFTASGCSNGTTVGGATWGKFTSGTSGTCTVTITLPTTTTDWNCTAHDSTTPADTIVQTDTTAHTTSCTISGTTVTGDIIRFQAFGY